MLVFAQLAQSSDPLLILTSHLFHPKEFSNAPPLIRTPPTYSATKSRDIEKAASSILILDSNPGAGAWTFYLQNFQEYLIGILFDEFVTLQHLWKMRNSAFGFRIRRVDSLDCINL